MENTKENDIIIRQEEEKDYKTTENLVREAFWNVYCPGARSITFCIDTETTPRLLKNSIS